MGKTSILLTYLCVRNTKCHECRTGSSEYYIIYNNVIDCCWPLLRVSLIPQISPTPHPGIEKLLPHLTEVREVEEKEGPVFPLQELLPADLSEVFRYSGSLTTPGCNEIVQVRPQWDLSETSEQNISGSPLTFTPLSGPSSRNRWTSLSNRWRNLGSSVQRKIIPLVDMMMAGLEICQSI